jgi:hypothetical protein
MRSRFSAKPEKRPQFEAGSIATVSTPVTDVRTTLAITLEVTPAAAAETLQTMTISVAGAAPTTFSSRTITSGKKLRIQAIFLHVEGNGSDTAPKRAYLRVRSAVTGATSTSSPLQAIVAAAANDIVVNASGHAFVEFPDGLELIGDGNRTFGFTLECPDYAASTGTMKVKATILAFEY